MEDQKIEMSVEELETLAETYGSDDPDIKAALELAAKEAPPADTGEGDPDDEPEVQGEEPATPPVEDSGAVESEEEPKKEEKQKESQMVPMAALQDERKKRQEAEARARQMEAIQKQPTSPIGQPTPNQNMEIPELFTGGSPGQVAKALFFQEKKREPDIFDFEDATRLQELTSLVTVKQIENNYMQQRVQAEREAFALEVQALAQEINNSPEITETLDQKFAEIPEGPYKKLLGVSINRLISGSAGREELDLIKEFYEETRQSMTAPAGAAQEPKKPKAPIDAAYKMPKTQDVGAQGAKQTSITLDLIEQKLDKGEKLTPEEESIIKSLG